ncbi:ABC transporter ATP-binding protein/permease [Ruminococcaceae bacterium OttesenSCG-928-A16]|nr:ABC transporter ATP-binding protein/permease [Ruminococcaceae bacterium OttesenSCG-928-A16]
MTKLFRYVKKYSLFLLVAVVLLFGQAILDLNLPNMMSNIVNVGIQKNGIEEIAPKAISAEAFGFVSGFMDEEDKAAAQAAYTPYAQLTEAKQKNTDKTFPDAAASNALVYTATKEDAAAADTAFANGGYAFVQLMQEVAKQSGVEVGDNSSNSAEFDLSQMEQLLPMLQAAPPEMLQTAIQQAKDTPEMLSSGVAAVLNKAFYQSLGANTNNMQTSYIVRAGGIMLLLSLAVLVCAVGIGFCFARIGAGVARDLRRDIYSKVSSFNNAEMDKFSTSSLITRTTNDVTQVQMMYTMGMRMMIYAPVMGIGGVIMALQKSAGMSWIIVVGVLVMMGVIGVLFAVVMPRFKKMQTLLDRLNLVSRENLSGIMVVRAFSNQKFQEKRFDEANQNLTQNTLFVNRSIALLMPIMMLLMNVMSLAIVWLGADQIAQSALQVGDMMAFIQYAMQIIMSFLFIAMIFVMVPRASVSAERINEVLLSEDSVQDPTAPKTFKGRAKGEVAFNNVSFRYAGADEDVLHDISFTAKPGQTTAFIGSTGSGKSTVVNLVPRFYDATEGSITIDGIDVRQITQHELRENIGYVPQKGMLFSGTIDSNLKISDENVSEEQVRRAAEIAQATEFIDGMDEGFSTEISQGGTNVSGGQRQRLSIARALVKDAPIYVFDDSFSALDFATDAKLRAALKPYTQQSTVLLVAQRVSTIMHAEQIVVLNDGKVAGIGTHQELLKNCETYREIAESQLSKEELA